MKNVQTISNRIEDAETKMVQKWTKKQLELLNACILQRPEVLTTTNYNTKKKKTHGTW